LANEINNKVDFNGKRCKFDDDAFKVSKNSDYGKLYSPLVSGKKVSLHTSKYNIQHLSDK
jgi:hypothetical protein